MNDYRPPATEHQTSSQEPSSGAGRPRGMRGLAHRLVAEGLLAEAAAQRAEQEARDAETSLLEHVITTGLVQARSATLTAAWEYGLPIIDLDALRLESLPDAADYPDRLLRKLGVLPLHRRGHRLTVAVPYPSTLAQLDELQFATGLTLEGILAPVDQLGPVLEAYLARSESSMLDELSNVDDAVGELQFDEGVVDASDEQQAAATAGDDAPIVKFVNKILLDAIRRGASDIHFEPYETSYRVRFRIDGILHDVAHPPFAMRSRIAARLKVMARLDISERRLPQDGAIKLKVSSSRSIDFRVNSLPTVYGEKLVLRILDPGSAQMGIEQLGFTPEQRAMYEGVLDHPQGMILVTGPTGSGKTVTLYTGINILNEIERNICTAEDPVEIKVPGVNQVNVLPKIGLDFASALRAFLRQDPDVVMVGEIRDLETAEIAVKASQTGHLVLSTVHTNSAAETLTRLANMGVAPFNIASSVSLIIAQRLARRLCPDCKQPADIPHEALLAQGFSEEEVQSATIYEPVGCQHCTQGFKGRVGIYEVVPISEAMSQLIMTHGNAMDFDTQAREEGHPDLRRSGLFKVMQGMTSLAEVNRVTKD
ncbi:MULTISPECIES: type IV-A pilus assembly ATPase PilB [Halomonas]|uniref:Type 4 fimbrial assembly protein PilB n=1 Tax=Halomonas halophila TaxID=29573 RepID=A0ABQ0U5H2_9GAMM|nr:MULTISPECIES: type IV-A pilus assembly ATPase PilB [Halomonas]MDR5890188.1 type IV-A pilus assembly ATPase PilB [Halomonas salina]WJY05893.1 type IV-A pilus assembly ATPase PilB [Halomonas halophila]GEK73650.1 type 4 fimbrial assembly protein PilB [Halomonas halophila]